MLRQSGQLDGTHKPSVCKGGGDDSDEEDDSEEEVAAPPAKKGKDKKKPPPKPAFIPVEDDSEDEDRGGGQDVDEDVEDGTHETHPRKGREDGDDVAPAERDSDSERLFAHSSSAGRIQVEEIASSSDPSAVVLGDGRRVAVCALTLRTRVAAASPGKPSAAAGTSRTANVDFADPPRVS